MTKNAKEFFYFVLKNQDIANHKKKYNLPEGDRSYYVDEKDWPMCNQKPNGRLLIRNLNVKEVNEFLEKYKLPSFGETFFRDGQLQRKELEKFVYDNLKGSDKDKKNIIYNLFHVGRTTDHEDLKEFNDILKYKMSLYSMNGDVIESGPTDYTGYSDPIQTELSEDGYYYFRLSSAGGKGKNSTRFVGKWFIKDVNNDPVDTIQLFPLNELVENPQRYEDYYNEDDYKDENSKDKDDKRDTKFTYNWIRTKKEDDGYTLVWKGNYTYLNNTVFLSLKEYGMKAPEPEKKYTPIPSVRNIEHYGILMLKEDITENDNKIKLFSYRIDDTENDEYSKYIPENDIIKNIDWDTVSLKGGDGQYFNEIFQFKKDSTLKYTVGAALENKSLQNIPGINSTISSKILLDDNSYFNVNLIGGGIDYKDDFGGKGGNFVYDHYKRIYYNDQLPEDGKLNIKFLIFDDAPNFKIDVQTEDEFIEEVSYPKNKVVAGIPITLKVLLTDTEHEIDFEKSTINEISFNEFNDFTMKYFNKIGVVSNYEYYCRVQDIELQLFKSENVEIKLKTKPVKFTITILEEDRIRYITDYTINGSRDKQEAEAGDIITVQLTYYDSDHLINENVFAYYLCLKPDDIKFESRDRYNKQIIRFTMPARHVLIRFKCDPLFYLTIQKNERQEFERKHGNNSEKYIEFAYIQNYNENGIITNKVKIELFPYRTKMKPNTIIDLYIKFSDSKIHLDKSHLYSQIAASFVEEAGNFDLTELGTDRLLSVPKTVVRSIDILSMPDSDKIEDTRFPSPKQEIPQTMLSETYNGNELIVKGPDIVPYGGIPEKEYYQHFRFYMPIYSLTIDLKWSERKYSLNFDLMEILYNRKLFYYGTNDYDMQRNGNLPRIIYPHEVSREKIKAELFAINNNFELITWSKYIDSHPKLVSYVEFDTHLGLKFNYEDNIIKNLLGAWKNYDFNVSFSEGTYKLLVDKLLMPKRNVTFFINIKSMDGSFLEKLTGRDSGSKMLTPGDYTIWIGGGRGGKGGSGGGQGSTSGSDGNWGSGFYEFKIRVEEYTMIYYFVGARGVDGGSGKGHNDWGGVLDIVTGIGMFHEGFLAKGGGGAGGSGGGSSLFYLDSECKYLGNNPNIPKSIRGVYCAGGTGGQGGDGGGVVIIPGLITVGKGGKGSPGGHGGGQGPSFPWNAWENSGDGVGSQAGELGESPLEWADIFEINPEHDGGEGATIGGRGWTTDYMINNELNEFNSVSNRSGSGPVSPGESILGFDGNENGYIVIRYDELKS
jgi:predicted RNA-binding protein